METGPICPKYQNADGSVPGTMHVTPLTNGNASPSIAGWGYGHNEQITGDWDYIKITRYCREFDRTHNRFRPCPFASQVAASGGTIGSNVVYLPRGDLGDGPVISHYFETTKCSILKDSLNRDVEPKYCFYGAPIYGEPYSQISFFQSCSPSNAGAAIPSLYNNQ